MSADDGKVLTDLPVGTGVDATKFDGHQAFASCRYGKLNVAGESASGKFEIVQTVTTPVGASTMDIDPEMQCIWLRPNLRNRNREQPVVRWLSQGPL
jgi:hypothetical protein